MTTTLGRFGGRRHSEHEPTTRRQSLLRSAVGALRLLRSRDRRILALLVLIQTFLALLDLVGVAMIGVVVLISSSSLTGQQPTGMAARLIEMVPAGRDLYQTALVLALAAGLLMVTKSVLSYVLTRRTFRFLANRQAVISSELASLLLARPLLDVQQRSSQDTATTLTRSVNQLTMGVIGGSVILLSESVLLVLLLGALLFVDMWVTLFAIAFFAIVGITVQQVLANWATSIGVRNYAAEVSSLTVIQDALRSYREISVTGRRGNYVQEFRAHRWKVAQAEADLRLVNIITKYIYEIALVVGGGLLAVSQFLTKDTTAALTVLAIFLAAATRILPSVMRMQTAAFSIRSAAAESQAAIDLHHELTAGAFAGEDEVAHGLETTADQGSCSYEGFDATVVVADCSLRYPGARDLALESVDLVIGMGQSVALVGSTGAGKSTLADLVLGVIRPDSGTVLVSGVEPAAAVRSWPGALAYVPQDVAIVEGTIRSNVALGLPRIDIDDDRVWEALELAHLDVLLRQMRNGLDTLVGENGVKLSGGQRQRLGVARALFTKPRLLVLDEATSALDAETERLVTDTVQRMGESVTTIIVAHRLATIRHCDKVVYMDAGRIVAEGTFNQVVDNVPDFARQADLLGLVRDV